MFFMGGGLGLVQAPATEAIMGSLPPAKAGVGSAVNDTARELGGTLGVAIVGSVFSSIYASRLGDALAGTPVPAEAVAIAKESVGAAEVAAAGRRRRPGPRPRRSSADAVDAAFIDGWHAGSWVSFGVVAARRLRRLALPPRPGIASPRSPTTPMPIVHEARSWPPLSSLGPMAATSPRHPSPSVAAALTAHGYLPDEGLATAVFLAMSLQRPLLLEGEAGVGKTEVAKVLAAWTGGELIRLQCYEGIDAAQAVYDWDYGRQLLHLRAAEATGEAAGADDRRPRGRAVPRAVPASSGRCCGPSTTARARRRCC